MWCSDSRINMPTVWMMVIFSNTIIICFCRRPVLPVVEQRSSADIFPEENIRRFMRLSQDENACVIGERVSFV